MYLEYADVIIDVNSVKNWYIIFLNTGFKYEYSQYSKGEKPLGCPARITDGDVSRAKNDGVDITGIKEKDFSEEEMQKNIEVAKKFLMSDEYPFGKVKS